MMPLAQTLRTWSWLVHKDLLREVRAPRGWAAMLLLGLVLSLTIQMQVDLPPEQTRALVSGLFWVAVFFAGSVAFDRSLSSERDEGCRDALRLYPITPGTVFLAKVTVNFLGLSALTGVLVCAFIMLSDVPMLARPWHLLVTVAATNLSFSAVGTIVSGVTSGAVQRSSLLILLLLPLVAPVVMSAAGATRSLVTTDGAAWGLWWQLLVCAAAVYLTLGTLIFEFLIED
jgi:heme exporter protein B